MVRTLQPKTAIKIPFRVPRTRELVFDVAANGTVEVVLLDNENRKLITSAHRTGHRVTTFGKEGEARSLVIQNPSDSREVDVVFSAYTTNHMPIDHPHITCNATEIL